MKSKTRRSSKFYPTDEHYKAMSYCFKNDIKAYIIRGRTNFSVELDYKGKIKPGTELYDKQEDAETAIWNLYLQIFDRLENNS